LISVMTCFPEINIIRQYHIFAHITKTQCSVFTGCMSYFLPHSCLFLSLCFLS